MAIPTEKPSFGPLDGVKVVYAAVELACPKAADLMADWGADVIWLENTGAGDTIRHRERQAGRAPQSAIRLHQLLLRRGQEGVGSSKTPTSSWRHPRAHWLARASRTTF
ncbi:MAG: CoA transferase [Slackia sp.]